MVLDSVLIAIWHKKILMIHQKSWNWTLRHLSRCLWKCIFPFFLNSVAKTLLTFYWSMLTLNAFPICTYKIIGEFQDWLSLWFNRNKLVAGVQVNLCQKLLILHQLTHNMTTDCSLIYRFKTWKLQAQTWGEHAVYRNCFWNSEQFMYTICSPYVLKK